jgi:hypothetical protein
VSTVVPARLLSKASTGIDTGYLKLVENCEAMLFQRPDEAVRRGADRETEAYLAGSGNFMSNFAALTREDGRALLEDVQGFESFSEPMRKLITSVVEQGNNRFFVSSAHPRQVSGKASRNVRYLQPRPAANPLSVLACFR